MGQSVPSISASEVGFASGILGAGIGYVLAPRKFDLGQILTLSNDVFERVLPRDTVAKNSTRLLPQQTSVRQLST